jgi:nitrilase
MQILTSAFKVAVMQAAPIFMDREATLDKACELVLEAGREGARLVVFPESFLPGYPIWAWSVPAGEEGLLNELYAEFLANAVTIPGEPLDKLCRTARRAKTYVVVGVSERNVEASGASLYNTLVYIDAQGQILGKHRQLLAVGGERLVWAQGDGSTLDVYATPFGRLGGLVGWENYMPLARYALFAQGVQLYIAATWQRGELWLSTLRHIAKEGRMFVFSACSVLGQEDLDGSNSRKVPFSRYHSEWMSRADSAMIDPDGELIAGPAHGKEDILYAEINPQRGWGSKWKLDVAGHDARPDVFQLLVNRQPHALVERREVQRQLESLNAAPSAARGI